jgi:hypothetical protein
VESGDNPWPHIQIFFDFVSRREKKLSYQCVLCLPNTVIIKAHSSTFQNVRAHMQRNHPERFQERLFIGIAAGIGKLFPPSPRKENICQ